MGAARQSYHPARRVAVDAGRRFLIAETGALLVRLHQVRPFEWTMPMVTAALPSQQAQQSIHRLIKAGRHHLRRRARRFIDVLKSRPDVPLDRCQSAFSILKLQFNSLLDQFDIFADVVNQRSEHDTGIWIAGLDVLARDTLRLDGADYDAPPLVCYLDRGHGAAIRRARTRLPGGDENPVAVIRVPRERMVGSGIGSSLVHEVGHQGAALLELIPSLKAVLAARAEGQPARRTAWKLYDLWISEILSDVWSVATLGISATTGLINVVSLPAYFVFRMPDGDPHPFPWIRVKISLAFGRALYPDAQWERLERLWERMYPTAALKPGPAGLLRVLSDTLPDFVGLVLDHEPKTLRGHAFRDVFPVEDRQPGRLRTLYRAWRRDPAAIYRARPGLVFAVVGQARADRTISPYEENRLLSQVLRQWALMQLFHH
jgi:hypothetical protein